MKPVKFRTKMILLSILPVLIVSVVLVCLSLIHSSKLLNENAQEFSSKLDEVHRDNLKNYTQLAIASIYHIYDNSLSDDVERQVMAKKILRNLRYGSDGYFFVYDDEGRNIIDPTKPHLEGEDLLNIKDRQGVYVIRELIKQAKNASGGYTEYVWDKPSTGRETDKLSFSRYLYKWDWMIGTGAYMDSASEQVMNFEKKMSVFSQRGNVIIVAIATLFILLICFFVMRLVFFQSKFADENLQKLSRTSIVDRERERSDVATTLNVDVANSISVVRENLKSLPLDEWQETSESGADVKKDVSAAVDRLETVLQVISTLSNEIRPDVLVKEGIYVATEALTNHLAKDSVVSFSVANVNVGERLDLEVETMLYRIIEEALTNIVLHSKARSANIRLRQSHNALNVTIQDDGVGFDPYEVVHSANNKGIGLSNMQLQAELLEGVFNLFSSKGTGTIIKLSVPI